MSKKSKLAPLINTIQKHNQHSRVNQNAYERDSWNISGTRAPTLPFLSSFLLSIHYTYAPTLHYRFAVGHRHDPSSLTITLGDILLSITFLPVGLLSTRAEDSLEQRKHTINHPYTEAVKCSCIKIRSPILSSNYVAVYITANMFNLFAAFAAVILQHRQRFQRIFVTIFHDYRQVILTIAFNGP
ncbi:hypothetical protein F4677DRAFT_440378 [Hypoxylon crocopeplum]|nr:hypothetical protein F4677DRAFT_440378 [Hypoxylon crocopeplum]